MSGPGETDVAKPEQPSFFEGTEKKIEIVLGPGPSLRERGRPYWDRVVRRADARILSSIANEFCDAYLLSESSLFVFDRKLLLITCGQTRLTDAALGLLDDFSGDDLRMFVYERKNEVFPHRQASSFFDDVERLAQRVPGCALRFGNEDAHHLDLFHLDRRYEDEPEDATAEILMYGLLPEVRCRFAPSRPLGGERLCEKVGFDRILPGFQIDDHLFDPQGYSLNAIDGPRYLTIHVTPDEISSYASLETNAHLGGNLQTLLDRVVGFFQPRSFDLITWERGAAGSATRTPDSAAPTPDGFHVSARVRQPLSCGYTVNFTSHHQPAGSPRPAQVLPIPGVPVDAREVKRDG